MKYDVIYTKRAFGELQGIRDYIESTLLAPDAAQNIADKIMTAIEQLDEMPYKFPLYEKEPWRGRGLRKISVENFTVFYMPVEKQAQVAVISIMYGGRNIAELLNN